jgi:hydroxymethylbilane synthase
VTPEHQVLLDPDEFVPAVGQGIIAVEARAGDTATRGALADVDDAPTRVCATAERAFLARLGASCHTPMAAHARLTGDTVHVHGVVAGEDGRRVLRASASAPATAAERVGRELAETLLERGAADITALQPVRA